MPTTKKQTRKSSVFARVKGQQPKARTKRDLFVRISGKTIELGLARTRGEPGWIWSGSTEKLLAEISRRSTVSLDNAEKLRVLKAVGYLNETTKGYSGINKNEDGRGLSWGFIQFAQEPGPLGLVLKACRSADAQLFTNTFGPGSADLIKVAGAKDSDDRMAPVDDGSVQGQVHKTDLWSAKWVERFGEASTKTAFQGAQDKTALTEYASSAIVRFALDLRWNTDRMLALVFDRCIQMGPFAGRDWIISKVGPIDTKAKIDKCLRAVNCADLEEFQEKVDLDVDGKWGPSTHAALVKAITDLLPPLVSPIEIPSLTKYREYLQKAADESTNKTFGKRVRAIINDKKWFDDRVYTP